MGGRGAGGQGGSLRTWTGIGQEINRREKKNKGKKEVGRLS